ncbi:MAG TPA: pyridoxamine 5'-phosphate oxidase family protein [Trebonia sp.]|nr:pyridoxamine 5'-phosphate oxidase family protein [Trebonia sp.]
MSLSPEETSFLQRQHAAAMITIGRSGVPKPVRVGVALVDGRLWSSGTQDRVRTRRLRRDPRCTLFVFDQAFSWLALETTVTILDGPEAAAQNVRLFREMQGRPAGPLNWYGSELDEDAFVRLMTEERRLVYEFDVHRSYGLA